MSDGVVKNNVNKTAKVKKLEKQLRQKQRCLSRKYEDFKKRNKNIKGEATRQNIQKQRLSNIRTDYINNCIIVDRDYNAALNLRDINVYKIA